MTTLITAAKEAKVVPEESVRDFVMKTKIHLP